MRCRRCADGCTPSDSVVIATLGTAPAYSLHLRCISSGHLRTALERLRRLSPGKTQMVTAAALAEAEGRAS